VVISFAVSSSFLAFGFMVIAVGFPPGSVINRAPFPAEAIFMELLVLVLCPLLTCVAFRIYLFFGVGRSCLMVFYFRRLSSDEPKLQTGDENDRSFQAEGMSMRPPSLFLAFAWNDTLAWVLARHRMPQKVAISTGKRRKFWSV